MKWQKTATETDISAIVVDRAKRQRQPGEVLDVGDIQPSMARFGLLNPVIIDDNGMLLAGERRLTAAKNLGWTKILTRKWSDLTPVEAQLLELMENIKRQDLRWQDLVASIAGIHSLYVELDPDWTMIKTATDCGISEGLVSMYVLVHSEMGDESISGSAGVREAYNKLKRRDNRAAGAAMQELLEAPDVVPDQPKGDLTPEQQAEVKVLQDLGEPLPAHLKLAPKPRPVPVAPNPESILHGSFLDWAPTYAGEKFNLVHCDFPYGIELFSGPQGCGSELAVAGRVGYKDSADVYWRLVDALCANLNRVMSVSAHLMFWTSADYRIIQQTIARFGELAPSLVFQKFPLIWHKSDNAGIASDPRMNPRHTYEACLMASRGHRQIVSVKSDSYSAPTDKRLHPSTKPEPVLRHFMEMLVDDTTLMLDPTCGSASSLRAAESLGAKQVLGLEIDQQYIEPARLALKHARQKRLAEKSEGLSI